MVLNPKKQLVEYLKKNITKGYTLQSLKIALIKQGYSKILIDRAIEEMEHELSKKVPSFKEKPTIKYEILDEKGNSIPIKKSFWKRLLNRKS